MAEKGDIVTDGSSLYVFQELSEGKIYLKMMDGAERAFTASGNPMWVVPPDRKEDLEKAINGVRKAGQNLADHLRELTPV